MQTYLPVYCRCVLGISKLVNKHLIILFYSIKMSLDQRALWLRLYFWAKFCPIAYCWWGGFVCLLRIVCFFTLYCSVLLNLQFEWNVNPWNSVTAQSFSSFGNCWSVDVKIQYCNDWLNAFLLKCLAMFNLVIAFWLKSCWRIQAISKIIEIFGQINEKINSGIGKLLASFQLIFIMYVDSCPVQYINVLLAVFIFQ